MLLSILGFIGWCTAVAHATIELMPLYEFTCPACSHRCETLCRLDEQGQLLRCPRCDHQGLQRVLSTFAAKVGSSSGSSASSCEGGGCRAGSGFT